MINAPAANGPSNSAVSERIRAVADRFARFDLASSTPAWSSWLLDQDLSAALNAPNGSVSDWLRGFDLALEENNSQLTDTMANLIKDVVTLVFANARRLYDAVSWDWANESLKVGVSAARSYFFLLALPPEKAAPRSIVGILRGLAESSYYANAHDILAEDLEREDVKPLYEESMLRG
jgi:hypothetical protein